MTPTTSRFRSVVVTAAIVAGLLAAPATSASASTPRGSTDGATWSVRPTGVGRYLVELRVPTSVAVRDAQPQLAVDGRVIGTAVQAANGRTLTVSTTDHRVAAATRVQLAWNGAVAGRVAGSRAERGTFVAPTPTGAVLAQDPVAARTYRVARADYDLGDTAVSLPGLRGRAVELRAAVYLPVGAPGRRPVVVFLHGRHQACYGRDAGFLDWPCGSGQRPVPSYLGYGQAAQALARAGDVVVSVSADGINALDFDVADGGAQARAELVLAHLDRLAAWNAHGGPGAAARLRGRLDLTRVGPMGHSRGGEGVVGAALLNAARAKPYGIRAVLPLAPVDFGRATLPGVAMAVVLPYCDGDVNDQQGQHFYDDSRYAGADNVLRTSLLVLGANHNFFNSEWTPGISAAPSFDDWFANDSVCGERAPSRLTAAEQRAVGAAYISGFFRLNLDGERQFVPMFDGTGGRAASAGRAVVYTEAQQPSSARTDLATLRAPSTRVTTTGGVVYCAGYGDPLARQARPCAPSTRDYSSLPHWTPAYLASTVPTGAMVRMTWTANARRAVTVHVAGVHDVRQALTFRAAPADRTAADLLVTLTDAAGRQASVPVSRISPALRPLPALPRQGAAKDPKTWLRTVRVPLADFAGVDLGRLRTVTLAAKGRTGDVYLSDIALDTPTSGSGGPSTLPVLSFADARAVVGPDRTHVAETIRVSRPSAVPITVQVQTDALFLPGRIRIRSFPVRIPAGASSARVTIPLLAASRKELPRVKYINSLSVATNAIVGDSLGTLTVVTTQGAVAVSPDH